MLKKALVSLWLILLLTGCTPDPNDQFIQGVWEIATPDAHNEFFQWNFDHGRFSRKQEIDRNNPLLTEGYYRVLESNDDTLILELSDLSGSRISYENNPITLKIEIDRHNESLTITNVLFVRAKP